MNIELTDEQVHNLATAAGYVKAQAPAPTTQTEAERLVEMANRLPKEVWVGSGWMTPHVNGWGSATLFGDPEWGVFKENQFRTILLGVMAAYVGTEPGAMVYQAMSSGFDYWKTNSSGGSGYCILTAYLDCCLAIHSRRSRNAK